MKCVSDAYIHMCIVVWPNGEALLVVYVFFINVHDNFSGIVQAEVSSSRKSLIRDNVNEGTVEDIHTPNLFRPKLLRVTKRAAVRQRVSEPHLGNSITAFTINRDSSDNSAITATVWCSLLSDAFRLHSRYVIIIKFVVFKVITMLHALCYIKLFPH